MWFFIILVVLLSLCPAGVFGAVTYGTHINGLYKSFYIQPGSGTAASGGFATNGIAFDPTSKGPDGYYDRIYFVNAVDYNERYISYEGLYSASVYYETYSARLALGQIANKQSYCTVVDANGNVYVCYDNVSGAIYKVTGASGASPVTTQMLGGYVLGGGGTDDDPITIGLVPTNFGGSYVAGKDLILFDNGADTNYDEAITVIKSDSNATTPLYTTIWHDGDSTSSDIRGAVSSYDGYAYFVRTTIPTAASGSGTKAYINRVKADGTLQRVFMNVSGGTIPSTTLDDAITVNPADGSVWIYAIYVSATSDDRALYRVDIANATLISGTTTDYMANATMEIILTGSDKINISKNDIAFSPDGKFFALATSDGRDKMYIYSTEVISSPSATYGSHINGLYKSFYIAPQYTTSDYAVGGLAFDPTSLSADGRYDRIYWLNRVDDDTQGLYSASVYNETYSDAIAMTDLSQAYDVTVDADGDVYVVYTGSSSLWKVTDASGSSPVETQLLGNYGSDANDDDPASIDMVPTGFGGSYTAGEDILIFDSGLNNDTYEAVSVAESTSTLSNQLFTTIWNDNDTDDTNIRGASSSYDGYAYIVRMTLPTATSGSGIKAYINRVKANGTLQRIFINVGGGTVISTQLDDSVAINPVDGSVWISVIDSGTGTGSRTIYRIDAANATLISGTDYMANATVEITLSSTGDTYNTGVNSLAFSPDGKFLAMGVPAGRDKLYIFSTEAMTSTPVNCADAIGKGYSLSYDLDNDCRINLSDFALIAAKWFECIDPVNSKCSTPWE